MKALLAFTILFSTHLFAAQSLEEKVCRSERAQSLDCAIAQRCEAKAIIKLRMAGNQEWNQVCSELYDKFEMVDPLVAINNQ